MKYRNTIIALAILILLGSYIYFFERQPIQETEPGKPRTAFIPKYDPEKVARLEIITRDTAKSIVIERTKDNSWEIKSPVVAHADKLEVDTVLREFKELIPSRIVDEKDLDFATYGLIHPSLTIILSFSDSKLPAEKILVGNITPNAQEYYVKKGNEPKLYLIPIKNINGWNKEVVAFRDKKVLEFEADRIVRVELKSSNRTFVCEKQKDEWRVTFPEKVKADRNKIEDLLWKLSGLEVKQFVDEQPKDITRYGLNNPSAEFIIKSPDGKQDTLILGKNEVHAGTVYAKSADKSYIFSLETSAVNGLFISSITEFRDRSVLTFDIDKISRIELKFPNKTLVCVKEKDSWYLMQPTKLKADETKIDGIIWQLSGLTIKEFGEMNPKNIAQYGLDKPVLTITLQMNTTKLPTVFLGKLNEKQQLIYAQSSDKDFIYQLDAAVLQELKVSETDLVEKKVESKS